MINKKKKILVTSALPYANGPIHLGHIAGAYLPADIFVRYHRLKEDDIIYICGSDEHGVPITIRAEKENVTPQEIVDKFHVMNKESFEKLGISFDNFSRTSLQVHHETSQDFFLRLHEKNSLIFKASKQLYCPSCDRFLADRFVEGTCPNCKDVGARGDQCDNCGTWLDPSKLIEPKCKLCGTEPIEKNTNHWYIPLGKYQKRIEEWMMQKTGWKDNVINYCRGWFKKGLEDRAVTRDLNWGIPVPLPDSEGKVLYVWFDAPIGYISSTKEWAENQGNPELWKDYWCDPDTKIYHFIGKDNIIFHAISFPAMLMEYGEFTLPENVVANEYLTLEGRKISTSHNYAVWLNDYLDKFPPDPLRYCLASISPEGKDSDFSWKDFQARNNNELADILGNFINRTLVFIFKYFDAKIPEPGELNKEDQKQLDGVVIQINKLEECLETFQVRLGLSVLMDIARGANKYFNDSEPWVTVRSDKKRCGTSLYVCCQLIKQLTLAMTPFLPFSAEKVIEAVGLREVFNSKNWDEIVKTEVSAGTPVKRPEILFQKIEDDVIQKEIDILDKTVAPVGNQAEESPKENPELVTIDDFRKLDLRVAEIKSVSRVPKTDKLLRLEVDDGDDIRFIVSGIAGDYDADSLVGKSIILLANLKPAKIRGEISNGMLLAAGNGELLSLLTPDRNIEPGSKIS